MLKRLRPWLVALGLGLAMLLWGLATLQSMMLTERRDTRARIDDQISALEEFALRALQLQLEEVLREAGPQLEAARRDPLLPAAGLVFVERGTLGLPRPSPRDGADTPAQELYQALRSGAPIEAEPQTPWADRLVLFTDFRDAIEEGDPSPIERSFREILRHRTLHVIDSRLDLVARVAALDLLTRSQPDPVLMEDALRRGLRDGRGALAIEGLQRALLERRSRFSGADFTFLSDRVIALSRLSGVRVDDFLMRRAERPRDMFVPARATGPMLLDHGRVFVRPRTTEVLLGTEVDLDEAVLGVEEEMRTKGLLEPEDGLLSPQVTTESLELSSLRIPVIAPRLERAADQADQRFWLKTSFVVLCAVLASVLMALAGVLQSRRLRFVELKSNFVAAVSHELRTPLASIRLMAETLERRTKGLPGARDYPSRIVRESDDLAFLVDNLLSFNRLDKGRWQPRCEEVDGRDLVAQLDDDLAGLASGPVDFRSEGLTEVRLWADPELLRLLLRNLAKNACNYCERDPIELAVHAELAGDGWVMTFTDNGVGIPFAERNKVFTDFYRGRGTRARGSGLGLSICRQIMQAHGGDLEIARSDDTGTTFRLRFPASILQPEPS
ncbi:MAG: sensor histidine kinase [Nannocystales bacterium]